MILVDGNSREFPIPTSRTSTDSIHRSVFINAADGLKRVRISPWVRLSLILFGLQRGQRSEVRARERIKMPAHKLNSEKEKKEGLWTKPGQMNYPSFL